MVENDLTSSASLIMYKAPSSALAGVSVPVVTVGGAVGQLYCSVQDEWLYPGLLYNYLTAVTNSNILAICSSSLLILWTK